jgi:hypothetical protein
MKEVRYYVAQIELATGAGWTSIHVSREGAEQALIQWAAIAGVNRGIPVATIDNFDLCLSETMSREVESYGISYLLVEE